MAVAVKELAGFLQEMAIALRKERKRCLLIAVTPDKEADEALSQALGERLEEGVEVLDFNFSASPIRQLSLSKKLRSLPAPQKKSLLFAYGLGELATRDRKKALLDMNWERETLAYTPYSVVLWVRPQNLSELMFEAGDFFS